MSDFTQPIVFEMSYEIVEKQEKGTFYSNNLWYKL